MKYFPQTIKKVITVFSSLFDEIYVPVYKNNIQVNTQIVPIKYAYAQKLISHFKSTEYDENNTRIPLPILSFEMNALDPDEERITQSANCKIANSDNAYILYPAPYNYIFDVSIWSKTMIEHFNILETILPRFQTTIHIDFNEYKFQNGDVITKDLPVTLTSLSISPETVDIGAEDEPVLKTTLTFNVKGWIYHTTEFTNSNSINNIDISFENEYQQQLDEITL